MFYPVITPELTKVHQHELLIEAEHEHLAALAQQHTDEDVAEQQPPVVIPATPATTTPETTQPEKELVGSK